MTKTELKIKELIHSKIEELGYILYDVMYLKESSEWYLRIFIDKENATIDLDDCEKVSNEISTILDEEDPIAESYNLEVSSCGVERHIREPEHFSQAVGKQIQCKVFKAIDSQKEFEGVLENFDGSQIELNLNDNKITIELSNISSCKLLYNWEESENE